MPVCYRSFVWAQDNSGPKIRNFHYGQYILFPFPSLPFPSIPFPFPPSHVPSLCPFLPIPSRHFLPLNPARGSGERCKLPQRVRAEPGRQKLSAENSAYERAYCDTIITNLRSIHTSLCAVLQHDI